METICRPYITLRNGKVLYAYEVGKKAFCFEVDKVRSEKVKTLPKVRNNSKVFTKNKKDLF